MLSVSGCTLATLNALDKGQALTPEQVKAYRDSNADVWGCFQLGGPPPAGNTMWIVTPKGTPVNFKFGDNCHLVQ